MTNFTQRTLTGTGLVTVILPAIWFGPYSFIALLLLIAVLSLQECYRLLETPGARPAKTAGALWSVCLILSCFTTLAGLASWKWLLLVIPLTFAILAAALYRPVKNPFPGLAMTFLGMTVISLPLCFFAALPFLNQPAGHYEARVPLGCFLLLWSNDTAAYLAGRLAGRHPLFKRISPGKTWEGSAGGLAAALLTAYVLSRYLAVFRTLEWALLSVIIVVTGTYGDLFKSLLKRSLGLKDSGTILPGHGGMLDRFDSLLGSAPFVFAYLILLGK